MKNNNQLKPTVLIVDDEPTILKTVSICLEDLGLEVSRTTDPQIALKLASEQSFDLAFIDLKMQPINGIEVLQSLKKSSPETLAIIITAHGDIRSAIEAIKNGAHDYLQKPFDFDELQHFTKSVLEFHHVRKDVTLRPSLEQAEQFGNFFTINKMMRKTLRLAQRVSPTNLTVLIEGESGTGKELVARLLHNYSPRSNAPFIAINCAAISENLLESELFGHIKGSFTGAIKDRIGKFEAADGGTLFLDEIGELSPALQAKLLRILQEGEVERVGSNKKKKIDVRLLSATNIDIERSIAENLFREDLFYRLNTVRLRLLPLRERPEDIPVLMTHFLKTARPGLNMSTEALQKCSSYPWPGNVRELENICQRLAALIEHDEVKLSDLPEGIKETNHTVALLSLEETEKKHIQRVLAAASDLSEAAAILKIDPATLWRKRKKYDL